jgi:PAS domain S-box-containing protein
MADPSTPQPPPVAVTAESGASGHVPDRHRDLAVAVLDAVAEAIMVFDPRTFEITDVNRGACDLLRRRREELVGHRIDDLLPPAEAKRLALIVRPLAAGERDMATVMLPYRLPNGATISVEVVLQVVELGRGARGIVAIARDISERIEVQVRLQRLAQSEHARAAELNAVIRAMGEAVIVCAADGRISLSNPAGEQLFPDVDEETYDDVLDQLHDPDGRAPRLGAPGGPIALPTRADHDRWVEISTYPVNVGVGLATAGEETIVVMRDVTETLRRDRIRETFIGVLSHELRTPVTTIFGGSKLLARESSSLDEETRRGIFQDIHAEAERLQRLVEDVVALNRFGEVTGEISWEPVLMQRVLPGVVHSEKERWPGVTFELDIGPSLPTVSADPTYVEQVIRNFLSNAAKYGGEGSTVVVSASVGDGEVIVRVLDDGPGFPSDETNRLFELFYRSPGTAAAASGAGIGLFVCARLVAAMGGRIWAQPRPEGGAEFGFALPKLQE